MMTDEQRLGSVKNLELTDGLIVFAERDVASQVTGLDGAVVDSLPPRTVVKIVLRPAKGSEIRVEVWLPDAVGWNGRFLGLGNGGAAGNINPARLAGRLTSGYAVATTDMGTAHSGVGNPEVWKDFGFRSTHLMTVVSKQVVEAFYGKGPEFSYFSGGSTGGQQALQEAQRYPGDYDGIIAGIPAHCRTPLHAYFLWNAQILENCPFSDSQQENIVVAGLDFMASRELPVLAGRAVSDPRCSADDIEEVIRLALNKDSTLTDRHAEALRKLLDGPRHELSGERIFGGIPLGSSFHQAYGHLYVFQWVFGVEKNLMELNFGEDVDTYTAALAPYLNAENHDLTPFHQRGGKIIMYSGAADACVPYHATLDYYERCAECCGGMDTVQSFFKYYLIPGMAHGPGPVINQLPDLLELLVAWREKGLEPDKIDGKRVVDDEVEMEVPIYPYPDKAVRDQKPDQHVRVEGTRGGVDRVAERFRLPAQDD